ncbi:glycosyltransferase [Weissella confusa]|uniref:glycosyltransferase n=1 Tax=Weissella confusa TaxID=1583 RepID=UPI0018F1B105|nr:glycosyltransferase [Weissella confusa]MBJ7671168.1 glycosyltransferase family 1 protein [Weissella confusa]
MKKILIYGPTNIRGGIETFVEQVLKEIKDEAQIDIVNFSGGDIALSYDLLKKSNVSIVNLEFESGIRQALTQKNAKILGKFLQNRVYDYFHINENTPAAWKLAEVGIKNGARVIYHSHNSSSPRMSAGWLQRNMYKMIYFYQKSRLSKLNVVKVAVSDQAAKWMFKTADDVSFLWNGVDAKQYKFDLINRDVLRGSNGVSGIKKIGLFVGRISKQKNLDKVLSVAKTAINNGVLSEFWLVGQGNLSESIERLEIRVRNKIKYYGVQSEISQWYSAADVLLMPSFYEGLPYNVVEAQASGLPVVLSSTITSQTQYTDLLKFVSLTDSDDVWVSAIETVLSDNFAERQTYWEKTRSSIFSKEIFRRSVATLYGLNLSEKR